MKFLYSVFVQLLVLGFYIGRFFNAKLRQGWVGRQQSLSIVKTAFQPNDRVIWMHAASLGEYEQGLPVLEAMKQRFPNHKILVTFFSPSGYEQMAKKKTIADALCYLPIDQKKKMKTFVEAFHTDIFFTVKYDYWYHLLEILHHKKVKIFVVSALFYPSQVFFKPYGQWMVQALKRYVDWFFHQTEVSKNLAESLGLAQSSVSGDTRFDRVKAIKVQASSVPYITEFKGNLPLVVFGSAWETEESIAQTIAGSTKAKIIIAPHDLSHISSLKKRFPEALLYSEIEQDRDKIKSASVLMIDSIGWLSRLYAYADIAVVGGGFHSAGLHNILEAAVYGVPVLFGNHYQKNPEADALIAAGGGQSFADEQACATFILSLLQNPQKMKTMGQNAEAWMCQAPSATQMVMAKVQQWF